MRKVLTIAILTAVTSAYLFPICFTFIPNAINSKMIVAAFGIAAFAFNGVRNKALTVSEPTLFAGLLAAIFSVWCLFSVTESNTFDMTYASYLVSFITWMFGAYGVCAALSLAYEEVNLDVLVRYLALACVFQCVMAVLIDNNSAVCNLVDRFMDQGQDFYKRGHRLYGLGAALDPAGIRFSAVLIMMAHLFATSPTVRSNRIYQATLLLGYAIIVIIGSVISRTTLVGASMGMVYMVIFLFRLRKGGFATTQTIQIFFWFFLLLLLVLVASVYFYRRNLTFQGYLRFGFEAFFNWVETGQFRTSSTDTLTQTMWVWPSDIKTWLIGRGTYGVFENYTDIGYCNFTFYCGLIGLTLFSIFFLYCHLVLNRKFNDFLVPSLLLVALTFVVWMKVTTDIFFLNALLFCAAADKMEIENDPVVVVPRE